jgi:copper chaperone CopZ
MNEATLQLDIPVLLPEIPDIRDSCVQRLEQMLATRRGVRRVHVKDDVEPAQLCLHFDPNLISLAAVQRMAHQAGGELTERYRHERVPVAGLNVADAAEALAADLETLPGMVHASVNYAAGLAFVAYDAEVLSRTTIESVIRQAGYRLISPRARTEGDGERRSGLLPRWLQARWRLLLVGAAGVFFLVGWLGATLVGLPAETALIFYLPGRWLRPGPPRHSRPAARPLRY